MKTHCFPFIKLAIKPLISQGLYVKGGRVGWPAINGSQRNFTSPCYPTKKLPISKIPRVAVAEANVPCEKPQGFFLGPATPRKTSCCSFWWSWKSTLDVSFFFRKETSVFFYQFDSTSEMLRGDVYKNDLMQTYLVDVLSTHPIWTKSMRRLGQNVESSYPTFVSKKNPNIFVTLKVRPLSRSL